MDKNLKWFLKSIQLRKYYYVQLKCMKNYNNPKIGITLHTKHEMTITNDIQCLQNFSFYLNPHFFSSERS
jgi:hypothetical protein